MSARAWLSGCSAAGRPRTTRVSAWLGRARDRFTTLLGAPCARDVATLKAQLRLARAQARAAEALLVQESITVAEQAVMLGGQALPPSPEVRAEADRQLRHARRPDCRATRGGVAVRPCVYRRHMPSEFTMGAGVSGWLRPPSGPGCRRGP